MGKFIGLIYNDERLQPDAQVYFGRLNLIAGITSVDFHIEEVTGQDKTVDLVVDIFNRVNSGGTTLSKGDLALAKVCAEWSEARAELNSRLDKWRHAGFSFRLEWLLRSVNTLVTGEALFSALTNASAGEIHEGLQKAESHIDYLLNLISSRLGLDHDRVLGSRSSFPLMVRYIERRGGSLSNYQERDRLLFWYVHTLLWGRYSSSMETTLNQDLESIEESDGGLDRLIETLRQSRGDIRVAPLDFMGATVGTRFYPFLYMLTRVHHARDWDTGIELSNHMLGNLSNLQLHHIFPKSVLRRHGYTRNEVNALANFTFLTQETNLIVSNRNPAEYLEHFKAKHPGAIESHWIPIDPELWKLENYREFLAARRELLAGAANEFLDSLMEGAVPESTPVGSILDRAAAPLGGVISEAEQQVLLDTNAWVTEQGLPEGELPYEVVNEDTGELLAELDLAWPNGVQEGYSQRVALLIDEDATVEAVASQAGFRVYTDVELLKEYINQDILAIGDAAD